MILNNKNDKSELIIIDCDCGCEEAIYIRKFVYENSEPDYSLSICGGKFYTEQKGIFRIIGSRLKNAWRVLRGKDYRLCDIIIKPTTIDELIEKLEEIRK